jgi:hypothetical protein
MRWLSRGLVLQWVFCLLKEVKLFVEGNKIIEEQDVKGWISGPSFSMDVTGHLNRGSFNKELQGKDKLITEMLDSIKALKVVLRLWEDLLKVHNFVHFPHLKSLETTLHKCVQGYFQKHFSATTGAHQSIPGLQNYGTGI